MYRCQLTLHIPPGKVGPKRQRRTLTVRKLVDLMKPLRPGTATCSSIITTNQQPQLEGFDATGIECKERQSFESKAFTYMFSKETNPKGGLLKEFKDLFACLPTKTHCNPSLVYYMELVDENADSNDTMRQVSETLLESLSSDYQDGYVASFPDLLRLQFLIACSNWWRRRPGNGATGMWWWWVMEKLMNIFCK